MRGQVGEYVDETIEQLQVRSARASPAGSPSSGSPRTCPTPPPTRARRRSPAPRTTSTSRCSSRRCSTRTRSSASSCSPSSACTSSADDDLRLLEIYASFAAQAMANADATEPLRAQSEALERQLRNQRELLARHRVDPHDARPAGRARRDRRPPRPSSSATTTSRSRSSTGRPACSGRSTAQGIHAAEYLEPWQPGEEGVATWVVAHNEPALVSDEAADPRVNQFRGDGPDGRQPDRASRCAAATARSGVLTLERLGLEQRYSEEEFELVQLFAGAGLDRAPERRGPPRGRDPGPDRRPDRAC